MMYAVVPTQGRYGSGEVVSPFASDISGNLAKLRREAKRATREYQRAMAPHGGSGGGYRVVEYFGDSWYGHDLDRTPDVQS